MKGERLEYGAVLAEEMLRVMVREKLFRALECDEMAFRLRMRCAKLGRGDVSRLMNVIEELERAAAPLTIKAN